MLITTKSHLSKVIQFPWWRHQLQWAIQFGKYLVVQVIFIEFCVGHHHLPPILNILPKNKIPVVGNFFWNKFMFDWHINYAPNSFIFVNKLVFKKNMHLFWYCTHMIPNWKQNNLSFDFARVKLNFFPLLKRKSGEYFNFQVFFDTAYYFWKKGRNTWRFFDSLILIRELLDSFQTHLQN